MASFRTQKVADVLRREISDILRTEIKDPGIGFVTVTDVEVAKDLRNAKVFVSIMGDGAAKGETMKALERARTTVQCMLGERIRLRFLPILHFYLDESIEYGSHIDSILAKIDAERSAHESQSEKETE
jgi:ribosome-binding factor A